MSTATRNIFLSVSVLAALTACSHSNSNSSGTSSGTQTSWAAARQAKEDAAIEEAKSVSMATAIPVHDFDSCLAATAAVNDWSGSPGAWPATAFAAYLEPAAFKAAQASSDGFKEVDLEKAVKPQADQLIARLNPKHTPYIAFENEGDSVDPYGVWYGKHGFAVKFSDTVPVYQHDDGGETISCEVTFGDTTGPTGNLAFVEVADETTARAISALVAQHKVHPRLFLKADYWRYITKVNVQVNASTLKVQLVDPDGKVLAESTGVFASP